MPKAPSTDKPGSPGAPGDKVALLFATLVATVVMGFCFLRHTDGTAVIFRVGITFGLTYLATFVALNIIAHIITSEMMKNKKLQSTSDEEAQEPLPEDVEIEPQPEEPPGETA